MAKRRAMGWLILLGCFVMMGCEDREERARYVKEPLGNIEEGSLASLNEAFREAETRLVSVRSDSLREELSKDLKQEYERLLARVREVERERAARAAAQAEKEREAERQRLAEAEAQAQAQAQAQRQRELDQQQMNYAMALAQKERTRQAVIKLESVMRISAFEDGTQVLMLRNGQPLQLDFDLKCYTADDSYYKTFFVSVPARGETEIGFVQGWRDNFREGEHCEAYFDGERLWDRYVPPYPKQ